MKAILWIAFVAFVLASVTGATFWIALADLRGLFIFVSMSVGAGAMLMFIRDLSRPLPQPPKE